MPKVRTTLNRNGMMSDTEAIAEELDVLLQHFQYA
jgi:hypothetical protein